MKIPGVRAQHLRLLRAVLGQGEAARQNWRAWIADVNIERLDHGTTRLLPLLYYNAVLQGVAEDEIPAKIKGVCRHGWSRNQVLLRAVEPMLRELQESGIDFMLIKGGALLLTAYDGDSRLRPLSDVDVMVRPGQLARAADVTRESGWRRKSPDIDDALDFAFEEGYRLRLRDHALLEVYDRGLAEPAWEKPARATLGGLDVLVPDPTSLLFHICVYGLYPPLPPPIRWAADASLLLRKHGPKIKWEELERRARDAGVVPQVQAALEFLQRECAAVVPQIKRTSFAGEYLITMWGQRYLGQIPRWWFHARRRKISFARYLMAVFGMGRFLHLPGLVARKAWSRWLRVWRLKYD